MDFVFLRVDHFRYNDRYSSRYRLHREDISFEVQQFGQRTFRGSFAKVIVSFKRDFWKEKGYSGYTLNSGYENCFVCSSLDCTIEKDGSVFHGLVCFLSGDAGSMAVSMTLDERKRGILKDLSLMFDIDKKTLDDLLLDYHEQKPMHWQKQSNSHN